MITTVTVCRCVGVCVCGGVSGFVEVCACVCVCRCVCVCVCVCACACMCVCVCVCVCGGGGGGMWVCVCLYTPLSDRLLVGSGVKHCESTALGITDTVNGLSDALNTVFSLLHVSHVMHWNKSCD